MKVLVSSIVLFLMSGFWYVSAALNPFEHQDIHGTIDIIVIDQDGEVIIHDTLDFSEEDTLLALMHANYHLTVQSSMGSFSGTVILGIESIMTDFESDFIRIKIDGHLIDRHGNTVPMHNQLSTLGVDLIPLIDGNTYIFEYAQVNHKGGR